MTYNCKEIADAIKQSGINVRYFPNVNKFTINGQIPEITNGGESVLIKLKQPIYAELEGFPIYPYPLRNCEKIDVQGMVKIICYNQTNRCLQTCVETSDGQKMLLKTQSYLQTQENSDLENLAQTKQEPGNSAGVDSISENLEEHPFSPSFLGIC